MCGSNHCLGFAHCKQHATAQEVSAGTVVSSSPPVISSPLPRVNSQPVQFMMVDFGGMTSSQRVLDLFHVSGVLG